IDSTRTVRRHRREGVDHPFEARGAIVDLLGRRPGLTVVGRVRDQKNLIVSLIAIPGNVKLVFVRTRLTRKACRARIGGDPRLVLEISAAGVQDYGFRLGPAIGGADDDEPVRAGCASVGNAISDEVKTSAV